jgi:HEAT repeat protein
MFIKLEITTMRKIFIPIVFLFIFALAANAQQSVLDKEPANNAAELNANAIATGNLGETGIVTMLTMLQPTGQADNTKIFDAISGFSFYTTQNGKEAWRATAVKAYSQALSKVNDKENQAFIISQLQIVGKDDAVATLKKYLNEDRLCDPSARALVKINTLASKAALLAALKGSKGNCTITLVEAIGDSRNPLAVKSVSALIGKDQKLTKVSLYAVANIADPISINLMANAAQKSGFTYDETNATYAYLLYIKNLGKKNVPTATRLAKTLATKASLAHQEQTHTAALKILVDMQGAKSTPTLIEAARNNNQQYRDAALKFAGPYINSATTALWVKELGGARSEEKAAIIGMLGNKRAASALPAILKELKDGDTEVKVAAITAAGKVGQDKVIGDLLETMSTGNPAEIIAVQNALLIMKGSTVTAKVADALPNMPANAQAALISVLAARGAHDKINVVLPLLNSSDPGVRAAAYASLKDLAGEDNLPQLYTLLASSTQATETTDIQAAIIAAVRQAKDKSAQSTMALEQMDKAPAEKKPLYLNILANIGDKKSLAAVSKAFEQGDTPTKQAAVTALSQWTDLSAAPELFSIAKKTTDAGLKNQALRGYVNTISSSAYPAEEKIIYLRNAIEIAQTVPQKKMILQEATDNKTFPALVFVSKYMNDPQLQEDAANDVSNIALSDKNFYGNDVKQWLEKSLLIKKGGDSDYEKVAIRKFIAEMPSDAGLVPLFNNKDLTGWKGLVGNPIERNKMDAQTLAKEQKKADSIMRKGWYVKDSVLNFTGEGENLCTTKQYRNFEMYVDWKIEKAGDAGIYLRGSPQVQIWDTSRVSVGAQVGSGGLYNNQAHQSKPLKLADNAISDWNNFHIIMKDDKVTVYLNGVLVVDNTVMDNYWDRKLPIFPKEQLELQAHGNHVYYRDIYLRELPD